ncbi:AMP-binding protein [Robiginitalea sp. IMCC43444]|uniref:AMP-binding protein n=1 Tax=Robiginitalea sp. IMCC43444 TaxID=3459121 RepID=UPI0040436E56
MKEHFHHEFYLNGRNYAYEDLSEVAYSLVKEGEPYEKLIGDFLLDWLSDSSFIDQKTSGSTGEPKWIQIPKISMVNSSKATSKRFHLEPGSRVLNCLGMETIAGKMMLVRAMVSGWKIDCVQPTANPLENFKQPLDLTAMVPLQLQNSLKKLRKVSKIIVGGAPMPSELLAALPKSGTEIYESYGMTETASHVALRKLKSVPEDQDREEVLEPFEAIEGVHFETDERSCLIIHASHLSDKPFVTNDLVKLEGETRFRWLGRLDHVINSGGVKLVPEKLEDRMSGMIKDRFFLSSLPDQELGEKMVLIVETDKDPNGYLQALRDSKQFSKYEIPREAYQIPHFEETSFGKINRRDIVKEIMKNR